MGSSSLTNRFLQATAQFSLDTQHQDMIVCEILFLILFFLKFHHFLYKILILLLFFFQHDAQFDYYARKLATSSSDRTIRIFDVSAESPVLQAELRG